MKLVVKKWGNGLALRVPKRSPEYGELSPGMEVDVKIRARRPPKAWKPYTVDFGPPDFSENHREYMKEMLGEKDWMRDLP